MWCDPNRKAVAMNIFTPEIDRQPSREEAEAALAVLRRWAGKASDSEISRLDAAVAYLVWKKS